MSTINFRKADFNDIPVIAELAKTIWNEHYIDIITQGQIDYMLHYMYSAEALKEQMEKGHTFLLIENNQEITGYLSYEEKKGNPGEYFLHKFYILNKGRNKNTGTQLFNEVEKNLIQNKAKLIRLYVNRENFKSINFYFKNGFKIESVINQDIGEGYYMNDFIMIKEYVTTR
jgi:ribosomal protein S18 acetylase RimI-like enzyme